ncbi:MAG: hypothetical protein ACFCU8_01950 [Thermosynechococcaceae cyanobacterium]
MQLGSYEHRKVFCQALTDHHIKYDLDQIPWPQLTEQDLQRLREIPFWSKVLQQKRQMASIARKVALQTKPTKLKGAITLLAQETGRQVRLIERMMEFYQIPKVSIPTDDPPNALPPVLMDIAFDQYLDAYILWGWFALAREQQFLPEALLDVWEPILDEDARHSIFFANWTAGQRFSMSDNLRRLRTLWQHVGRFIGLFDRFGRHIEDATLPKTASTADIFMGQLTAARLLQHCLDAHDQRLASVEPPLVKPQLAPELTQWLLRILQAWPRRQVPTAANPSGTR